MNTPADLFHCWVHPTTEWTEIVEICLSIPMGIPKIIIFKIVFIDFLLIKVKNFYPQIFGTLQLSMYKFIAQPKSSIFCPNDQKKFKDKINDFIDKLIFFVYLIDLKFFKLNF